jgi:uncharacterized protein
VQPIDHPVAPPEPPGDVRWGMGDAAAGTVIAILASGVVAAFVAVIADLDDFDDIPLWGAGLLQIPLWAGLVGVPWWATNRKGRRSLAIDFGLRMQWRDVPIGLAWGVGGQILLGLVLLPVYRALGIDEDQVGETAERLADRATDPFDIAVLFVVVVIGAAVFEELFYRGLWLRAIERRLGTAAAVVLSSVLFGLVHFQWVDTIALAGFGLIAAVLTVRSGRLGPAIWAHVAFNLTALIALLA